MEPRPGESPLDAPVDLVGPEVQQGLERRPRPGDTSDPAARGYEVRQAHPHPEQPAFDVLGSTDVPRGKRPPARRMGGAPERPVSAHGVPRALPDDLRGVPRGAARHLAQARLQWDIWEAVFSPVGSDGYPKRIWDKLTGRIDKQVAAYWKEHYDLFHILQRGWATLGPKLEGKIHVYCGDMDNYYLNNAVYLLEEFLKGTTNPFYGGEVDYGDRAEHCWNGDHTRANAYSRLRYNQMYVPKILARISATAPAGADTVSWKY